MPVAHDEFWKQRVGLESRGNDYIHYWARKNPGLFHKSSLQAIEQSATGRRGPQAKREVEDYFHTCAYPMKYMRLNNSASNPDLYRNYTMYPPPPVQHIPPEATLHYDQATQMGNNATAQRRKQLASTMPMGAGAVYPPEEKRPQWVRTGQFPYGRHGNNPVPYAAPNAKGYPSMQTKALVQQQQTMMMEHQEQLQRQQQEAERQQQQQQQHRQSAPQTRNFYKPPAFHRPSTSTPHHTQLPQNTYRLPYMSSSWAHSQQLPGVQENKMATMAW